MRIFVTGATGFVGSHFVELALARGHQVVGTYSSDHPDKRAILQYLRSRGAQLVQADIGQPAQLQAVLQDCECVCHFAAAFRESGADDGFFERLNVAGTRNVLTAAAAAGVRRFVFCGTAGIHGQRVAATITEQSPVNPFNAYENSKVAAEAEVRRMCAAAGMEWVIVRPTAVYGPRDERLLKLFKSAAKGRFPLFGPGAGRRHMIYVKDLAELFLLACTAPQAAAQEFIAAGPRATSLRELLRILGQAVGRKSTGPSLPLAPMTMLAAVIEDICLKLGVNPPLYRRRMDFYVNDAAFDSSKAAAVLGWRPVVDLPEGLAATYTAYKAEGRL